MRHDDEAWHLGAGAWLLAPTVEGALRAHSCIQPYVRTPRIHPHDDDLDELRGLRELRDRRRDRAAVASATASAPAGERERTPRERLDRFKALARRATAYWKMSALLFLIGAVVAVGVAMATQRIYRSECVVLVKPAMKTDDREESPSERALKLAPKLKDTLLTRSRLEPIIREFGLYPKTVESKGMIDAVEEMRTHVGFRGRDSETFVISFEDTDAERARAVTQRLAESTMDEFKKNNLDTSKQQADFLTAEEKHAEEQLETANRELATFLAQHPEFAADTRVVAGFGGPSVGGAGAGGPGAPPAGALMPAMAPHNTDPALASLFRQKQRLEQESHAGGAAGAALVGNEGLATLTRARDEAAKRAAQAQADLADKRTRLTDQHPDVVAARAQVDSAAKALQAAEAQLETARKGQAAAAPSSEGPAPELQKKLDDVNRLIAQRQSELAKTAGGGAGGVPAAGAAAGGTAKAAESGEPANPLVALETDWQRLLRATSDAKSAHDDIVRRLDSASLRASAAEATGDAQMEIIDAAYKPTRPTRGGRTNVALAGLACALFIALGYAFARVLTDDTLIDAQDLEMLGVVPTLGVIPRLKVRDAREVREVRAPAG